MTDKNAIQIISGLLQDSATGADSGNLIPKYIQKYPYFIPARYIKAAYKHKKEPFSDAMLSGIYPYTGNWLLLLDHIEGIKQTVVIPENRIEMPVLPEEQPVAVVTDETEIVGRHDELMPQVVPPEAVEVAPQPEIIAVVEQETVTLTEEMEEPAEKQDMPLLQPVYADDYFLRQGIKISGEIPENLDELVATQQSDTEKSLMVMMSFTEWLLHFKHSSEKQVAEREDQKAVRTMWQKEKLAAALEEEDNEIPENVFEMAVNSITKEDGLASESLADIYRKQGKYDQAMEMYRKLSLRNPQKNAYFARKIEEILKDKQI